ncbi:MAG: radical SAM protein [Clostridia bacterium]|nr:radical SAM protein [Clostridia bacterium]
MKIFQKGFNYSQDGPGNRLVYHLSGCNLKCRWCSNPEGMVQKPGKYTEVTVQEILDEIISCKPMFFSGGGVTFTGGEPTLQFDELKKLLTLLKKNEINTAIETNATHPRLCELLPCIDHLIMDFKHFNKDIHKEWTGLENTVTFENFERVCNSKINAIVRIPVINGFNNTPDGFVEYFKTFDTHNISFEILPYHEFGKVKWESPYTVENGFITKKDLESFEKAFINNGLKIIHM